MGKICNQCGKADKSILCHSCRKKGKNTISNETILAEIRRLAKQLNHHPTSTEYDQVTNRADIAVKRFGSWRQVIEAAGLVYTYRHPLTPEISDQQIRDDLFAVKEKLGRFPKFEEYKEYGKYSKNTPYRFGKNWAIILVKVFGISLEEARKINHRGGQHGVYRTTEERLEELRQLARRLGRTPPLEEACHKYKINTGELIKRVGGSWEKVCEVAGLPKPLSKSKPGYNMTETELLTDLGRVAQQIGKIPTQKEYNQYGKANHQTLAKRLGGSWKKAKERLRRQLLDIQPMNDIRDNADSIAAVKDFFKK